MRCVRILNSCIFNSGREGGRDEGIKVRNMIKEELLFRENDHNNHIGLPRLTFLRWRRNPIFGEREKTEERK